MTLIATHPESVAATPWSADDEQFFRITRELFPPSYLLGATVLLASYDEEPAATADAARAPDHGRPARESAHTQPAATTT